MPRGRQPRPHRRRARHPASAESPEVDIGTRATMNSNLQVEGFFDPGTWTISYIVFDRKT